MHSMWKRRERFHFRWPFYEPDPQEFLCNDVGFTKYRYYERASRS